MRIHNQIQCNKNIAKDKEKNLENKKQCITYKGIPSMISSLLLSRKLKINARRQQDIVLKVLRGKKKAYQDSYIQQSLLSKLKWN